MVGFYHQLFDNGNLFAVNLFLDFEDWRFGARGFSWDGNIPILTLFCFCFVL